MGILSITPVVERPAEERPGYRANPPPRDIRRTVIMGGLVVAYTGEEPTQVEVDAWVASRNAKIALEQSHNTAINNFAFGGQTLASLKQMTNQQFDDWWTANIDTFPKALTVLKLLTRAAIRRLL